MPKKSAEHGAALPAREQGVLLVGVLDGGHDGGAGGAAQVALDEGVQARDGAQHGAPGGGALLVRVERRAVALLRAAPLGRPQVQAGLVVLGADVAFGLAVVAGLVVDVAEVAAVGWGVSRV
jgi:hypothetical protein